MSDNKKPRGIVKTPATGPHKPIPDTGHRARSGTSWARYLPLALLVIAMVAAFALGAPKWLSLEAFVAHRDKIKALVDAHHTQSLAVYVLVYVVVVALSLPGGLIMTIIGGFLFGWLIGGAMAMIGATSGATLVFFVARSSFGNAMVKRAGPKLGKVAEGLRENAISYMLFLRFVPVFPFWLVNLAAALFNVGPRVFIATTALGILPGTFAFAIAGAGLDSVIAAQHNAYMACVAAGGSACEMRFNPRALVTTELMAAFVALGLVALIPIAIKQWRKRDSKPSSSKPPGGKPSSSKPLDDGRDVA